METSGGVILWSVGFQEVRCRSVHLIPCGATTKSLSVSLSCLAAWFGRVVLYTTSSTVMPGRVLLPYTLIIAALSQ